MLDVLLEEVFSRQAPDAGLPLLATLGAGAVSAPLAEAVTRFRRRDEDDRAPERANPFVILAGCDARVVPLPPPVLRLPQKRLARRRRGRGRQPAAAASRALVRATAAARALAYSLAAATPHSPPACRRAMARALIRSGDFKELTERMAHCWPGGARLGGAVRRRRAQLTSASRWRPASPSARWRRVLAAQPAPRLAAELASSAPCTA